MLCCIKVTETTTARNIIVQNNYMDVNWIRAKGILVFSHVILIHMTRHRSYLHDTSSILSTWHVIILIHSMAYLVNRHMLRGISVFCEPPQKPINRGVHGERNLLISEIPNLSDQFGNLFSLFLDFSLK